MVSAVRISDISKRGVATIEFSRPNTNNAYDDVFLKLLADCLESLKSNSTVRLIILRGKGKNFQAGADLKWLARVSQQEINANHAVSRLTAETLWSLDEFPKPTIALVQGVCMGGGTGLVASCDIVLAEKSATFAVSEVSWGLVANIIFPQLVSKIGVSNLRRYALTGERFSAVEAHKIGLVSEICEIGELDNLADRFVSKFIRSAPLAVEVSKSGLRRMSELFVEQTLREQLIAEHAAKRIDDEAREGILSFLEKKYPTWFKG